MLSYFYKKDGYGFHMLFAEYPSQKDKQQDFISVGGNDYADVVEVNLADSPIFLPRAFFIDEQQAEQVIRKFFQGGKRHTDRIWVPTAELNWDLEKGRRAE